MRREGGGHRAETQPPGQGNVAAARRAVAKEALPGRVQHTSFRTGSLAPESGSEGTGVGVARAELPPRAGGNLAGAAASGNSLAVLRRLPRSHPRPAAPPPRAPAATLNGQRPDTGWTFPRWDTGGIAEGPRAPLNDGSRHERSQPVGFQFCEMPQNRGLCKDRAEEGLPGAGRGGGDHHSVQGPSGGDFPKGQSGATVAQRRAG